MTIGEKIKRFRKQSGMKACTLAENLKWNKSYISQMEHGKRKPSQEQLQKIADALGYPLCAFDDTDYDYVVAMHRLFSIYQKYDGLLETDETIKEKVSEGSLEEGVYISFKSLAGFMATWYEKINDVKDGNLSEEDFQEWMDRYTAQSEPSQLMRKVGASFDAQMNKLDTIASQNDNEE